MLQVATEFPQVGSFGFIDLPDDQGRPAAERVRILRDNGDGTRLVSLESRRWPHEVASGNRTVPAADLRATEHPQQPEPKRRKSRRA